MSQTVRELLAVESRWVQSRMAEDVAGQAVLAYSENACRWCLVGAVYCTYSTDHERRTALARLHRAAGVTRHATSMFSALSNWNDAPGRTHAEVLDVVTKACV